MKKVKIFLENCYGIKKLQYDFDFQRRNTYALYSPNGVMKTSFAKTFRDIIKGTETHDLIFPEFKSVRNVCDENDVSIEKENIFVIEPYNETYKSEKVSTLLVNAALRNEYEKINIQINDKKDELLDSLKPLSEIKAGQEEIISGIFTKLDNGFFTAIMRIKNEVLDNTPPQYEGIIFKNIFSDKVEQFLSSKEVRNEIKDYITKYDELIGHSKYFKKGVFNHTNASTIAKNLKENGFFKAQHTVNLVTSADKKEIKSDMELEEIIEQEKQEILTNPELVSIFNDLDKKITANKDLREFREYLLQNISILPELSNLEGFKEKLWISYFKQVKEQFRALLTSYEEGKNQIEAIITQAKSEITQWSLVIDIFNSRFSVPFKLSIGNQDQVILNSQAPVVKFNFNDRESSKTVDESDLLRVLSTGEKRALYLLNILFEIEARKSSKTETLFIMDDIADSFDYKNKYAIIEYLKDISEFGFFHQIILTHNYDFFRTISSRLDMIRENKLNTDKTDSEIIIFEEKYQNNPFYHWKKKLASNPEMLIAAIPFVRNLAEFIGEEEIYNKLTSLLHYKVNTNTFRMSELQNLFKIILKDQPDLTLPNPHQLVIEAILTVADEIIKDKSEKMDLEKKICLSMAIRLKAEIFMINKINDDDFWQSITRHQTNKLIDKYKLKFSNESAIIHFLEQVNLMTPENIHINSFMYEPILDMSNHHLKQLYSNVASM